MDPGSPCPSCARPLRPDAAFCSHCGSSVGQPGQPIPPTAAQRRAADREWGEIRFVLVIYLLLLGVQGFSALASYAELDRFLIEIAATILFAVIALFAALRQPEGLGALYRRAGFGPAGYALVAGAAIPIAWGVLFFVGTLQRLLPLEADSYLDDYRGHEPVWPILLVCVAPAMIEELCFRGFMFGTLRRRLRLTEAFLVSSIAFAILHLSVISLVTHVPMGIYFCWLRHRSASLYPAMWAHFLHNGWVLAHEAFALLPLLPS